MVLAYLILLGPYHRFIITYIYTYTYICHNWVCFSMVLWIWSTIYYRNWSLNWFVSINGSLVVFISRLLCTQVDKNNGPKVVEVLTCSEWWSMCISSMPCLKVDSAHPCHGFGYQCSKILQGFLPLRLSRPYNMRPREHEFQLLDKQNAIHRKNFVYSQDKS